MIAEPAKPEPAPQILTHTITEVQTVEISDGENSVTETVVVKQTAPVSALSLASIRAKRELEQSQKSIVRTTEHLTEAFNETDMLLQWNKYAQKLSDNGQKIMEALLLINDPKLDGTTIVHELPNEGSKIDFEGGKHDLVGYLRGKLHNHDIDIKIVVNEKMESKKAFTPQDRYNRLNQINPQLDTLRRTFDLDF
ncbi:DNA polymerase III subunit gamma/tau [Flavobacterium agri]|nr:DNA polymerase III subunit gamma/tau [Flavobacterium agri]